MKKYAVVAVALPLAVVVVMASARYGHSQRESRGNAPTLPSSLDNFYPPKGNGPVYFFAMHEMADPSSGLVCDLFENDLDNARANFENFKKGYIAVADMVPEWKELFPMAPVDELESAMKTGDPQKIMAAMESVGGVCDACHMQYMPAVQHKYHWGNFGAISVTDPVTNEDMPFKRFMLLMETSFTGAGIDLKQGQMKNAQMQFAAFAFRFRAMSETCTGCHDSERMYYVDKQVLGMIDSLSAHLSGGNVDPATVGALFQGIGTESCYKCHLVHMPAAYSGR